MTIARTGDDEGDLPRYTIRILIRHPNVDPDRITNTLGLVPHLSAMVGSVRKNPAGVVLPGLHKDSVWSHSFHVEGNRSFFSDVVKVIDRLELHKAFLAEIEKSGGTIDLIVHLPGDVNMGSTFSWREMARLCAMRIDLGIEVFPDFN